MKYLLLCEVNVEFSIASSIHTVECEMVNLFNFSHLGPLSIVVPTHFGATTTFH
jgi:hypothetical protein